MKRWIVFAFFALSFLLTVFISKEDAVIAENPIETTATYSNIQVGREGEVFKSLFNNPFEEVYSFPGLPAGN